MFIAVVNIYLNLLRDVVLHFCPPERSPIEVSMAHWLIGSLVPVINDIYQVRSLITYCVNKCFEL